MSVIGKTMWHSGPDQGNTSKSPTEQKTRRPKSYKRIKVIGSRSCPQPKHSNSRSPKINRVSRRVSRISLYFIPSCSFPMLPVPLKAEFM